MWKISKRKRKKEMLVIRKFSLTSEQKKADDRTNMLSAAGILGSIGGGLGYYGIKKRSLGPKNPMLSNVSRNAKLLTAGGLALSSGYGYLMRKYHKKKYGKGD